MPAFTEKLATAIIGELNDYANLYSDNLTDLLKVRQLHEDCINEREICAEDYCDQHYFHDIFSYAQLSEELCERYEELEREEEREVQSIVRDLYPEWRHTMG